MVGTKQPFTLTNLIPYTFAQFAGVRSLNLGSLKTAHLQQRGRGGAGRGVNCFHPILPPHNLARDLPKVLLD